MRYLRYALISSLACLGTAWGQPETDTPLEATESNQEAHATPTEDPQPITAIAEDDNDRPWAVGVSPQAQQMAKRLFREGTDKLMDSFIADALARYDAALRYWDHPAIHFNYAVALSTLDKPLETRRHLLAAIAHGEGPLNKVELTQARRYLKLVEASLTRISIRVDQPNVVVSINGKPVLRGPGTYDEYAVPDEYEIRAVKSGYLEQRRRLPFLPGHPKVVELHLYTEAELTRYRRRWPAWAPITVTAAAAIAAGVGGWMLYDANQRVRDVNADVNDSVLACGDVCNGGIGDAQTIADYESVRADAATQQRWGTVLLAGGAGVAVAGLVLILLNDSEAYRINPEQTQQRNKSIQVTPALGLNHVSLRGSLAF